MIYSAKIMIERFISEATLLPFRILYRRSNLSGPLFRFGRGVNLCLRNDGSFQFGRISCRRNLTIFCDGGTVALSDGVFLNSGCSLNSMSSIEVGEGTIMGECVRIYDHDHALDETSRPQAERFESTPVKIGRNCWIGANVVILRGVTICDGVTIGAGAVVTKGIDVPGIYVSKGLSSLGKLPTP